MARQAEAGGTERKLEELRQVMQQEDLFHTREKLLIFTEAKDTLDYLVEKLRAWGFRVTQIHGGMRMDERVAAEREFAGPAQIMVATEAAGEGINLQFCHLLVNYDIPWNPNRLEQRMGRVHRYGQDQEVFIYNLEAMRRDLGDRVYDVIGPHKTSPAVLLDLQAPDELPALSDASTTSDHTGDVTNWSYGAAIDPYFDELQAHRARELEIKERYVKRSLNYLISRSNRKLGDYQRRQRQGEDMTRAIDEEEKRRDALMRRRDGRTYTNVDVVCRFNGDDHCYGWNNESYVYNWRHPSWKLEKGRYIAKIRVKTGGREFTNAFLVVNDVPYEDFRIEPLRDDLKARV